MIVAVGALLGFISVAFAAYAEHGLRGVVIDEQLDMLMKAVRYNQLYAILIVGIGLSALNGTKLSILAPLQWSGWLFIAGTILFSFSIYSSVYAQIPELLKLTPIGGMTLMAAWLALAIAGVLARKKQ